VLMRLTGHLPRPCRSSRMFCLCAIAVVPCAAPLRVEELRDLAAEGITEKYLTQLALVYVWLVMDGERSVTKRLAEIVGKSPETIKIHLKERANKIC
jgi:hypothetical protein